MNLKPRGTQHLTVITAIAVLFALALTPGLFAGNVSGQVDFVSSYIWRGMDLNPDNKPVLQPGITYTFGDSGFSANLWFSISFEDEERLETDVTLSYDFKISENIALSAGIVHFAWYLTDHFNFDDHTSHEVFVTLGLPKIILSPSLSLYYDFHNGDGLYIEGSIAHSLQLTPKLNLDLTASLGYNDGQWLEEDSGFSDLNIGLALPLKYGNITITPYAYYTAVFLDELGKDNHFWAGVSLAF